MKGKSLQEFKLDLKNFADKIVPEQHHLMVKRFAFDVYRRIVMKTPVDTGRARGNWGISVGTPHSQGYIPSNAVVGAPLDANEMAHAMSVLNATTPQQIRRNIIWISNDLPYIQALENGHSKQSPPHAMVAMTIEEIKRVISG